MKDHTQVAKLYKKISNDSDEIIQNAKHIRQLKIDIFMLQKYAFALEHLIEEYKKFTMNTGNLEVQIDQKVAPFAKNSEAYLFFD